MTLTFNPHLTVLHHLISPLPLISAQSFHLSIFSISQNFILFLILCATFNSTQLEALFFQSFHSLSSLHSLHTDLPSVMASSAADALTNLAAALVVSTRQWQTGKSTNASTVPIEDDIRAIEERIERVPDTAKLSTPDRSKLDSVGTELWNVCRIHVMEECPDDAETKKMNDRGMSKLVMDTTDRQSDFRC